MGYNTAQDLAQELDLEVAIAYHLQGNHYPPVPLSMVEPCIEAIDAVNDAGLWDLHIVLPNGITWRGETSAPAHAIIEAHHLESWIIEREEY